jgi:ketosteroid isomerase-like protein
MEAATDTETTRGGAEFVERFRDAWAHPDPDRFAALFDDQVALIQPILPDATGKPAAREVVRRLLEGFAGLHGEVLSWRGDGELVFIELRLLVPGARSLEWTVIDKVTLRDGLITERVTYMDSLALLGKLLTRPTLWLPLVRLQISRR